MLSPFAFAVAGVILGLIVGSFLSVIVMRWPKGESAVHGRSKCDGCGARLYPVSLFPLISYLFQRGRARCCGMRIDPIHIWIEAAAAVVGGASFGLLGWDGAAVAVFGWLLLPLLALDVRHFWLPNKLVFTLFAAGLGIAILAEQDVFDRLIGAMVGYAALRAVGAIYYAIRKREGLGGGDPKLLGAIGAWTGWIDLPLIILLAAIFGLIWAIIAGAGGVRIRSDSKVPLGAFMALAAWPVLFLNQYFMAGNQGLLHFSFMALPH